MDAAEYDKIVDKLMQFRGKIPDDTQLYNGNARRAARKLRVRIDNLLDAIDWYSKKDDTGWIR